MDHFVIAVSEHLCVYCNKTILKHNWNTDWSRQWWGTEVEGGVAGGVYVTHWGFKSWPELLLMGCWTVLFLPVARRNQVVICCYSSWKGNGAGGDGWELSLYHSRRVKIYRLFSCVLAVGQEPPKRLSKSLKCVPVLLMFSRRPI